MRKHLLTQGVRIKTPQTERIPGREDMEMNNAGGFAWKVDDWMLLNRFLVLGTEGGTYYVSERKLTKDACDSTRRCIKEDGKRVVDTIVEISDSGRAPKNDYALFVLAMCLGAGGKHPTLQDIETRRAAFQAIPKIARIGTHLFHLVAYTEAFRGWGRGYKDAIASWYNGRNADGLAYQLAKYQSRDGWSHFDVLRLAHPNPNKAVSVPDTLSADAVEKGKYYISPHGALYAWVVDKAKAEHWEVMPKFIGAFEEAKAATSVADIVKLIREHNLPRECIPTQFLSDKKVWAAMLTAGRGMPMTAMIRNLGNMSKVGLLVDGNFKVIQRVCDQLTDEEILAKARVHPLGVLAAMVTYGQGRGARGRGEWNVVGDVVDALDSAFYKAFKNVEPTNKRIVIGLDVSGSMNGGNIVGIPAMTPRMGACAMSMVTYKVEPLVSVMAFCHRFVEVNMSKRQRLDDLVRYTDGLNFGGTNCALPILWAEQMHKKNSDVVYDAFLVYTDSETWYGDEHPSQALDRYRNTINPEAKLVVVGMTANDISIADPTDVGMLDVVGFDTATPNVISEFLLGRV